MRTVGLLGGMSWESTATYYQLINRGVAARLGGYHSARIVMVSVDFQEIEALQREGQWDTAGALLGDAAHRIEAAGAELLLICTNTMHKVADRVASRLSIPLLHIVDPTGVEINRRGLGTVGLLGTAFTMREDFYRRRLEENFGLSVLVPSRPFQDEVHRIIYEELCHGIINDASRGIYIDVVNELVSKGAEAIILGCTEIGLLLEEADADAPLLDTTVLHAAAAVDFALASADLPAVT